MLNFSYAEVFAEFGTLMHNPAVMVGCVSSPQHTTTGKTSPSGKRIFIPQERVIIERPIPLKLSLHLIEVG